MQMPPHGSVSHSKGLTDSRLLTPAKIVNSVTYFSSTPYFLRMPRMNWSGDQFNYQRQTGYIHAGTGKDCFQKKEKRK